MIRSIALWLLIWTGVASAQTMEQNDWLFLRNYFPDGRLSFMLGTKNHHVDTTYGDHIADNLVKRGQAAPNQCASLGGVSRRVAPGFFDKWINEAERTANWHTTPAAGYRPVGRRFNIVPEFEWTTYQDSNGNTIKHAEFTGRTVNVVMCKEKGFLAAFHHPIPETSSVLAIGPMATELAKHPPASRLVMPHEFSHIYQNAYMPAATTPGKSGIAAKVLTEGMAEASAMFRVFALMGGQQAAMASADMGDFDDAYAKRFYMSRAYNVPLQLSEGRTVSLNHALGNSNDIGQALVAAVDADQAKLFSYRTNGFFYHITERYLYSIPGRITPLYQAIDKQDTFNIYPELDHFLDRVDGPVMKGLAHVFPQFLTEYTEWWAYRGGGGKVTEKTWLNTSFGGCPELRLSTRDPVTHAETEFGPVAGGCFDVVLEQDLVHRGAEIELLLRSEDDVVRDTYVGLARVEGLSSGLISCYKVVEETTRPGNAAAPCLLDPLDGDVRWTSDVVPPGPVRSFHIGPLRDTGAKKEVRIRLVASHVPSDLTNLDAISVQAHRYRLIAAAESSVVEGDGLQEPPQNANPFAQQPPSTVATRGRLAPGGTVAPDASSWAERFTAQINIPGSPLMTEFGEQIGTARDPFFVVSSVTDEAPGFSAGFIRKGGIPVGLTGAFDVFGTYGDEVWLGVQDPSWPSRVEILKNTQEELIYRADIHTCLLTLETLLQAQSMQDICVSGGRKSVFIDTSVALPELQRGNGLLSPNFAPLPPIPSLEKYQNLRLAKIGQQHPGYEDASVTDPIDNPPPDPQVLPAGTPGSSAGESCQLRSAAQVCDCSCAGQLCFDASQAAGSLSGADKACRLTCGAKWMQCGG